MLLRTVSENLKQTNKQKKEMLDVFAGPFLCYRCPTHIAAIFDCLTCLFSTHFSWHTLKLTSSNYIQENMEREPHLPHLLHPREIKTDRMTDGENVWKQETPLKTISTVRPYTIISNVTHCSPHAHTKTFIMPWMSADGSVSELFTSGNAGTI